MKRLLFLILILSAPALAQDKDLDTVLNETAKTEKIEKQDSTKSIYAPTHCDFETTFPEEPFVGTRCPQGVTRSSGKCYDVTNYTMVYNLKSTVDVSVTCVPSPEENFKRYNDRVIQTVLNGMSKTAEITDPSINITEKEDHRIGTLIGTGKQGKQNRIYNAQIWIGKNSIMTIEAKLIGRTHHEADAVFAEILKSVRVKK